MYLAPFFTGLLIYLALVTPMQQAPKAGQVFGRGASLTEMEYPYDTLDHWLTLGIGDSVIWKHLGKAPVLEEDVYWGAIGTYVQEWKYPEQGVNLFMESDEMGGKKQVLLIHISHPCLMKTTRGIGLGSSKDEVYEAYEPYIEAAFKGEDQIVAGSIYGGVIMSLKERQVQSMYIGALAE